MWDQYKLPILGIIAAILAQSGLISWLIYEHRRRSLAEVRSRNALAELANMNRLATAGQLSASIAHEINQPVTGIVLRASAALRWLPEDMPNAQKVRGVLTEIIGAGERATEIITSVRAMFNKDSRAKVVPINLNNLINTVLVLLRVDLQKDGVSVETQLDEQSSRRDRGCNPASAGDPQSYRQCRGRDARCAATRAQGSDQPEPVRHGSRVNRGHRNGNQRARPRAHLRSAVHDQSRRDGDGPLDLPRDH